MEQKLTLEHQTQGTLARMSLKQCEQCVPRLEGSRKAVTGSSNSNVAPALVVICVLQNVLIVVSESLQSLAFVFRTFLDDAS